MRTTGVMGMGSTTSTTNSWVSDNREEAANVACDFAYFSAPASLLFALFYTDTFSLMYCLSSDTPQCIT